MEKTKKAIVYSTNPCQKCKMLKERILKQNGIDFEEIYIPNGAEQTRILDALDKATKEGDVEKTVNIQLQISEFEENIKKVEDLTGKRAMPALIIVDVKTGDELVLDYAVKEHDGSNVLPVQYNLAERMKVGEPLFMFDGKIRSQVIEIVSDTAIRVRIENDGFIAED